MSSNVRQGTAELCAQRLRLYSERAPPHRRLKSLVHNSLSPWLLIALLAIPLAIPLAVPISVSLAVPLIVPLWSIRHPPPHVLSDPLRGIPLVKSQPGLPRGLSYPPY